MLFRAKAGWEGVGTSVAQAPPNPELAAQGTGSPTVCMVGQAIVLT